jgi:hypothetical protein
LLAKQPNPPEFNWSSRPGPRAEGRKPGYREHSLDVDDARPRLCIDTGRGLEEHELRSSGWDAWIRTFVELCQALV